MEAFNKKEKKDLKPVSTRSGKTKVKNSIKMRM